MNILFIDRDTIQTLARRTLIEERFGYGTELATSIADVHMKFKKGVYDLVILDHHTVENGQRCFDYITAEDAEQKILTVSSAVRCVVRRCEDCVQRHNVRRLNNPTPLSNIMRMIEDFTFYDCDHYDHETNLLNV